MDPRTSPRAATLGVGDGYGAALPHLENHSQEGRPAIRSAAPDTRANGTRRPGSSPVGRHQSTAYPRPGVFPAPPGAPAAGAVSERMSMRQPVSLAASRAF